jgi:small subunit ribosomal protein S7
MNEEIKLFGKWSYDVKVLDKGLERYINLTPKIIPKSCGRHAKQQFHKSKMNIVERFITHLMVPGHKSKKHVLTSGRVVGRWQTTYKIVEKTFDKIYEITKKNPLEVFVRAIENAAIREEIAAYQVGGIIVRKAVVTSPQRRVDLALRHIAQAAYKKAFGKKANMVDALVEEIIGAYENNPTKSEAIREKERIEKEAEGAR